MLQTLPSLEPHPCSVALEGFEGPLDLLLHLVEQAKLDITAISLVAVTDQYFAYMRAAGEIDHRALADFVSIGARLIELKSRALLPAPPAPPEDEEEAPDDLVEMLREYQRFKQLAALLRGREESGERAYPRLAPPPEVPPLPGLSEVTLDRLAAIVQKALARGVPAAEPAPLPRLAFSVRQKMAEIELALRGLGGLRFGLLVERCGAKEEVITAFFAVLELMRQGRISARQDERFGDITLAPSSGDELEVELAGVEQAAGV